MLYIKQITDQTDDWEEITALNERAFPANERRPLEPLLCDPTGSSEILAFYDGGEFCGFACLLTVGDISHIIYFAIEEAFRQNGCGSAALAAMRRLKPDKRIIADIELEDPLAENNALRIRRKEFYLRNGYTESGVRYSWRRESYEILVCGGRLSENEFFDFWTRIEAGNRVLGNY